MPTQTKIATKAPPLAPTYFPFSRLDRIIWMAIFGRGVETYGPLCGIPLAAATRIRAEIDEYIWYEQEYFPQVEKFFIAVKDFRDHFARGDSAIEMTFPLFPPLTRELVAVDPGLFDRIFTMVAMIKLSPNYNVEVIGKALGIIATPAVKVDHPQPEFTLNPSQGVDCTNSEFKFKKHGHLAVIVEVRVEGGSWVLLGIFNKSPFMDKRPLAVAGVPEKREYRMRWYENGEGQGEWSPVQGIFITP